MDSVVNELVNDFLTSAWFWVIVILGFASYVINIMRERKLAKESYKCPRCGGYLLEKNGKYGKFIGCSNFPKCRFTLRK